MVLHNQYEAVSRDVLATPMDGVVELLELCDAVDTDCNSSLPSQYLHQE
jgi:hypothetical protein